MGLSNNLGYNNFDPIELLCFGSKNLQDTNNQFCNAFGCPKKEKCRIISDRVFPNENETIYDFKEGKKILLNE